MIKPPLKYKILLILILLFNTVFGQTELIQELDKSIIEIRNISPDSSFDDINRLLPILKNTKIVGLGEATHGTHDFFVYKHRLIKLLTTQADFKVIIIEGDFTGSQIMNDYVLYGKGTLNEALLGVSYGIWMTKEFASLIEWIKKYNSNKNYEEKIRFYGFDMNNPSLSAKKVKDFLKQKDKATKLSDKGLDWFIEGHSIYKDYNSKKDTIRLFVKELNNAFKGIDNKNEKEYKLVEHSKRILEQIIEMILANSTEKVLLRDKFMAENIEWIYDFENKTKTILWAHNEHIINNNNKKEQKPIGYYLKEKFSNEYYSFGFGFYKGANCTYSRTERKWVINIIPAVSIKKSTDAIFGKCKYPNFILDFKTVKNNELIRKFLKTDLYHRAIGATYYPEKVKLRNYKKTKLFDSFDGIIFFRNTKPSEILTTE